jgi:hypothetical protein
MTHPPLSNIGRSQRPSVGRRTIPHQPLHPISDPENSSVFFPENRDDLQDFCIFFRNRMYSINVRTVAHILPRIFVIHLELNPGQLGTTVIVSAVALEAAVQSGFQQFPEYLGEGRRGHVYDIEYREMQAGPS